MQGGPVGQQEHQQRQNIDDKELRLDFQSEKRLFGGLVHEPDQTGISHPRQGGQNKNQSAACRRSVTEQAEYIHADPAIVNSAPLIRWHRIA
ncbi:MAG: hypothetical protein Tsb0019_19290 [Roseibium sp.]